MRAPDGIGRPDGTGSPVLVVVMGGRLAMTVASTDSGDTPRLAVVQPARSTEDAAAIAPTREGEGVIMLGAEA
jgi:hypothetical protein